MDLRDILHPQRAKKHGVDFFWTHPLWVPLKQRSRASSATARHGAALVDTRGADSDQFFYNSGGGWDSTTSVSSPVGPRPARSPTTSGLADQVDVTGHVELAMKFEPARRKLEDPVFNLSTVSLRREVETHGHERVGEASGRRARSPRRAQLGSEPSDDSVAAALKRLNDLPHTAEIDLLKHGLKAYSYRGFEGQDPRNRFREKLKQAQKAVGGPKSLEELNCDQFLYLCRKGGRKKIDQGSRKEKEMRELFSALDLDCDELITIDEFTAFVWNEPPPSIPPGFGHLDPPATAGLRVTSPWGDDDDDDDESDYSTGASLRSSAQWRERSGNSTGGRSGSTNSAARSRDRFDSDSSFDSDSGDERSLEFSSHPSRQTTRDRRKKVQHGSPTVASLRKELWAAGLPVHGSEHDLMERLSEHSARQERKQWAEEQGGANKRRGAQGGRTSDGSKGRSPRSAPRRSPQRGSQRSPQRSPQRSSPGRGQLQLHRIEYDSDDSRGRTRGRARSPVATSPRGRSPSRATVLGDRVARKRRSPSPSSSRIAGRGFTGSLHSAHTITSERKARHTAAVTEDRSRRAKPSPAAIASERRRTSPSPNRQRAGDRHGQAPKTSRTRSSAGSTGSPRPSYWDSDDSEEEHKQEEDRTQYGRWGEGEEGGSPRPHVRRQRHDNDDEDDDDSLQDEAEREDFHRAPLAYKTRISGGMNVHDRGRRTHSRSTSPEGGRSSPSNGQLVHVHAQESGVGPSQDLLPTIPSSRRSREDGRPTGARLTLSDQLSTGKRLDGFEPPSQRTHSPRREEQVYVHDRHHLGHHLGGDDRLRLRRANPSMQQRARWESSDSPIALRTNGDPGANQVHDGGGPAAELKTAFFA